LRVTAPPPAETEPASAGDDSFDRAPAPSPASAESAEPTATESWTAGTDGDDGSAEPTEDSTEGDEDELAVLYALERGEIGVDEAADRLEKPRR
jgi:hypothetical protein